MRKAWALFDIDDTIVGVPFESEEGAQTVKDSMSYLGEMLEIREIDFNDDPSDEETEVLQERLRELCIGMKLRHFHMSKGPNFYTMSLNERLKFMIDLLSGNFESEEVNDD